MRWLSFGGRESERKDARVADPTRDLLEQLTGIHSRIPWVTVALFVLAILWIPTLPLLPEEPIGEAERSWVLEALTPWEPSAEGPAFTRMLTRATWDWQGAEIGTGELSSDQRTAVRLPAAASSFAALLIFFLLARLVVGDAAALLSLALLASAGPWVRAGTSALPLVLGEMLVLFGVTWALLLQDRHREVGIAGVTATRIGIAGAFLGIGVLLTPAGFATFLTTVVVWLLLGLRRSSSDQTTLPVDRPAETTFFAVFGTVVLLAVSTGAAWAAERFSGGSALPFRDFVTPSLTTGAELWSSMYRQLLSPGAATDVLVAAGGAIVLGVRVIEWRAGRLWAAAGLAPWVFLGVYFLAAASGRVDAGTLDVPLSVPPLFLLGMGWMILRGLRPGRIRRQEYTFLVLWIVLGLLLVPIVPRVHHHDPTLAALVTLLPPYVLIAGRAGRALWEAEENALARIAIALIAYLPVVILGLVAIFDFLSSHVAPEWMTTLRAVEGRLPWILFGAVLLGVVGELVTVRPDVPRSGPPGRRPRRGRRGGRPDSRRRRGGGRRSR